jgi:Secretion system C-terminal sorting domain
VLCLFFCFLKALFLSIYEKELLTGCIVVNSPFFILIFCMKKISISARCISWLILLTPIFCFAQNGLLWSAPLPISSLSFGTASPRLTLLSNGNPAAIWGTSNKIWFSKMENGLFIAPQELNTGGIAPGIYDFGGLDIAASGDHIFVVFEKFQQGIFCIRSIDNGATWQTPVTVFSNATGHGSTISSLAVDALGNPMVSFLYQLSNETNANVQLVRSLDAGQTFSVLSDASAPAGGDFVCECCYQDILPAGGDTVFVAFRNNRSNIRDMWVTRSTDGGTVFSAACDVDAQDWQVNVCPFSGPRMVQIKNDSLLTVWMTKTAAGLRVFGSTLSTNTMDKGWEFAMPQSGTLANFTQNHPDVAGNQDTIAMVWEETGFSGNQGQEIICAFSTTGTLGLSENKMNVSAASATQKFPQLAYKNGVFHLVYTDPSKGLIYRTGTVVAPSETTEAIETTLNLAPNPIIDVLKINGLGAIGHLEIYSTVGKMVFNADFKENETDLSLANLSAGVYFLKVKNKNGVWRFVKI